jgi:hypothetical protein
MMSQYMGFDADVAALNDWATNGVPDVAVSVDSQAAMIQELEMANPASVFSSSTVRSDLGTKYNALLGRLHDGLVAFGASAGMAAQRLKTIADNYERIDQSIAGQ